MAPTAHLTEETFEGAGGLNIFMRSWRPAAAPRAVIVIVHGFDSHSGHYFWVADQLVANGFAVYALDLRGRGKSQGERYYVEKFADYTSDVHTLVKLAKARETGLPVFLFGHSAGGVISCGYTLDHQAELAGLICESFAFEVNVPDFALGILKGLSHLVPHAHLVRLELPAFSRDPKVIQAMKDDPLIENEVQPAQTAAEMIRASDRIRKSFPRITLPVLILHGTLDRVTKPHGSQFFYDNAGSKDKTLKLYNGHFHDLMNDINKEAVMADVVTWIEPRLKAQKML